jgi:hypothetical protein
MHPAFRIVLVAATMEPARRTASARIDAMPRAAARFRRVAARGRTEAAGRTFGSIEAFMATLRAKRR